LLSEHSLILLLRLFLNDILHTQHLDYVFSRRSSRSSHATSSPHTHSTRLATICSVPYLSMPSQHHAAVNGTACLPVCLRGCGWFAAERQTGKIKCYK